MRYKATFFTGFAAGYVLGARAGRARYDAIRRSARKFADSPAVQETAGVLQAQAAEVVGSAKRLVGQKVTSTVAQRIGGRDVSTGAPPYPTGDPAVSTNGQGGH
ncbi:MAG: YtxH domain-containing protein [Actinomycetota bacterium]|nr:YtxH domain-containing protein [Actinomycetota bacterium]